MGNMMKNLFLILFTVLVMALSIAGPELFARYRDQSVLGAVHQVDAKEEGEGYRYTLSSNEKLYILSESLSSQALPESEQYALTRSRTDEGYGEPEGNYAFVVNHRGPSGEEITDTQIYDVCNRGLSALKELGILPDTVKDVEPGTYDAVLYSAIDVLEPRNNVAVWKLEMSNIQKNADKENHLINAYIDADDGKMYEFYVRTPRRWEEMDPDRIMETWSSYMGLVQPRPYDEPNPLMETTPYFKKYVCPGAAGEHTIVTVGFYEGINEFFLKITK